MVVVPVSGAVPDARSTGVRDRQGQQAPPRHAPPDEYRTLMSGFPTGVAVVTTIDRHGRPRGLTCSSLSSVTLDPPTLLVCIHARSGTLQALRGHGSFAVNLLHARGRRAAEVFSSPAAERFAEVSWRPSRLGGLPWLARDAFALAECVVTRMLRVGDHSVVLGEVTDIVHAADMPLLYGMRQFSAWLPEAADPGTR